jgi:ABC-type transport system involved in multi-copper enzyme maturation permease subunit
MFWILIVILALTSYGLSTGHMRIASGDSQVGGTKAWITSQFAVTQMFALVVFLFYSFFVAIATGMAVIQDDEFKIGEILNATPLRPREYIWGRFLGILAAFLIVLGLHTLFAIFFGHVFPHAGKEEIFGPFRLANYVVPALLMGVPTIVLMAGTAFAMGTWTRKPILVFVFPVAMLLVCGFFVWNWSPSWLDPKWNKLLMLVDPAGFRWLNETWLKVDRGVGFYNSAPVPHDGLFWLNRALAVGVGLLGIVFAERRFAAALRGADAGARGASRARAAALRGAGEREGSGDAAAALATYAVSGSASLAALGMRSGRPGFLRGTIEVLRADLRELRSSAGLYLFVPIILLQVIGTATFAVGAFDTPLLNTAGGMATAAMNTLTLLVCLLLLFYTVESLEREKSTGFGAMFYTTPVRTASILLGKALANSFVGIVVLLAAFLGSAVVILAQGKMPVDPRPFLLVWGLLLVPTFIAWTGFTSALWALTSNRFTTYGIALGALMLTGYLQMAGKMSWVGNWNVWSVVGWSDLGVFELDRKALLLNRLMVLGLAGLFITLTARVFARRSFDAIRVMDRLRGGVLLRGSLALVPSLVVVLVSGAFLGSAVDQGFGGRSAEKLMKDYWRKNLATWKDAPLPSIARVDVDLTLEPRDRAFRTGGTYLLVNRHDRALAQVPLTIGLDWKDQEWTLNDEIVKPEDRSHLLVFTPPQPLAPGDSMRIGFKYRGVYPKGVTKNGGGNDEFILPSGVVLTSFRPSFVPMLGFQEGIGVDEKNRYDSKEYPDNFYVGVTKSGFGVDRPYPTRIRITGPAEYTLNSVGTCVSDSVSNGRRTVVWESDHPVTFFNVVAGRWETWRGDGTAIFYDRKHKVNIEEMGEALDGARRYYSEWFYPFPWRELKLSEFPALANYAQGFPTNITFSEGIGFLTKSEPKTNLAFMVTAHEAAHQWWGNILSPGEGPGGNILSEGMAHFSTMLLIGQVKGEYQRMAFAKGIESRYGDNRQADSERPMVKIDGSRAGDTTVMYDKGGWVFWMLLNHMGRDNALAGCKEFIETYRDNPDHPVLQDFVAVMRPHAPDSTAYDAFVRQWFFEKIVPEYRVTDAKRTAVTEGATDSTGTWEVTATIANAGTGVMPLVVAATAGEAYDKEGRPKDGYRAERQTIVLGAGESVEVTFQCGFKPERVVVDPDVLVLQLERERAVAGL